ncbi:MAG: hypothetical protein C4337_09570 [Armatimonadota bacterium]
MLLGGTLVPMLADQKGMVLSSDGERRVINLPHSAFEGIPHDPSSQGGSAGWVQPIRISTEQLPSRPLLRPPFRQQEAPLHEVEEHLVQGDSTAAQIFQLPISNFSTQALDSFRWFDAIDPNGWTPPDTNIAVGPNHVVVATSQLPHS